MRLAAAMLLVASIAHADTLVSVSGDRIVLHDPITFDSGKATIQQASFPELDQLEALIDGDKHLALVEVGVHTDARGDDKWNLEISQKRADAVVKYLVDKGVAASRLRAKGYGESRPIDKGHNERAWAKNRRTEIVIVKRAT